MMTPLAAGKGDDEAREKQRKEKEKLAALMAKQEREAVKKYLETQGKKDARAAERTRQSQEEMAARGKKGKDAPWSVAGKDGGKEGGKAPPPPPPKKKKPAFQQVTLTCRQFSVDDVQDVTFEGSHLEDVPFLGLPEVAVFGRSNVGKSSLLNCLSGMNKRVAVVSKTPGRTQQINLFKVRPWWRLCMYRGVWVERDCDGGDSTQSPTNQGNKSPPNRIMNQLIIRCTTRRALWRCWWTCRGTGTPSCPRPCRPTSASR